MILRFTDVDLAVCQAYLSLSLNAVTPTCSRSKGLCALKNVDDGKKVVGGKELRVGVKTH